MSYSVTVEFPSAYAFSDFEHKVTQVINDGSGIGGGVRDIAGYFTDESRASRAYRKLSRICKQFPQIDAIIQINKHNW